MASFSQPKVLPESALASKGVAPSAQTPDQNPLLNVIGAFENDPEYDALMEDVYEYRRQLDARENPEAD